MSAVWFRVRRRLRAGRGAVVGLTIVVALGGGLALTLLAGATRTLSAPDRYTREKSLGIDVTVEQESGPSRQDELATLPAVARVDSITFVFGGLTAPEGGPPLDALTFVGTPRGMGTELVDGHLPSKPGEFIASSKFTDVTQAHPGDRFRLITIAQGTADRVGFDVEEPDGPTVDATLVGVYEGATELQDDYPSTIFPTSLLDEGDVGIASSVHSVDLAPGSTRAELRSELDDLPDGAMFGIDRTQLVPNEVRDGVNGQAIGLLVLAAIVAIAAVIVVGQVLGRQVRTDDTERLVLRGMGESPRQLAVEPLAVATVPVVTGVVLAAAISIAASGIFPIGFAERVEPDPGLRLDPLVHLGGALLFAVAVLVWVAVAMVTANRSVHPRPSSRWVEALARGTRRSTVATALRYSFGRGSDGHRSAWSTVIGVALVLAGVIGAVTFGSSLVGLVDTPERYGAAPFSMGQGGSELPEGAQDFLDHDPAVESVAGYDTTFAAVGSYSLDITGVWPIRGDIRTYDTEGRFPTADDEIFLGRVTARDLGVGVDDRITVKTDSGDVRLLVTGLGVILATGGGDGVGHGGMMTSDGMLQIDPESEPNTIALSLREGSDVSAFRQRVHDALGMGVGAADRPTDVLNLGRIRTIPYVVAMSLGLLAVLSLGHQLLLSASRRRRDVAVLRALGANRGWARELTHWQATLVTIGVLALAVPIGLLVGSIVYRSFVDHIGAQTVVSVPVLTIVAIGVALLFLANVAAIVPARRLRRASPAADLAAE